MKHSIFVQIL